MLPPDRVLLRLDALAAISSGEGMLTRLAFSPEMQQANALVGDWLTQAGFSTRIDAAGNLIGRREGREAGLRALMIGSHIDTVRDAGRYDGTLGVVVAIECAEVLRDEIGRWPFALEIVAFGDEEGSRFGTTVLGSLAMAGMLQQSRLDLMDSDGTTARDAIAGFGLDPASLDQAARRPQDLIGYLELHIEQGPVLESRNLSVAAVSGIFGATRGKVTIKGEAGHAGTVPMNLRRDALAGAAEMIGALEDICTGQADLVGTVGTFDIANSAANVVAGVVTFSFDIRALDDHLRATVLDKMASRFADIAARRRLAVDINRISDADTSLCGTGLQSAIGDAMRDLGHEPLTIPSGAGHDGAHIKTITDYGMIFVRSKGGISHSPAEYTSPADIGAALDVLAGTMRQLAGQLPPVAS